MCNILLIVNSLGISNLFAPLFDFHSCPLSIGKVLVLRLSLYLFFRLSDCTWWKLSFQWYQVPLLSFSLNIYKKSATSNLFYLLAASLFSVTYRSNLLVGLLFGLLSLLKLSMSRLSSIVPSMSLESTVLFLPLLPANNLINSWFDGVAITTK